MLVESIKLKKSANVIPVIDCCVGKGYLQGESGSLPDVDIDYQSDRRQEVKEYLERRYNKNGLQRVFSAGTFTTMKIKAVLKDVARVHHVPVMEVNYINKIIDDDAMDYTGLFKLAYTNKKVRSFIETYPRVIEDIRTLMNQPRSSSVHASAIVITPEIKNGKTMECFDFLPVKKIDDILVSEIDGASIDEVGLLKNDCLGIKELTKLQKIHDLVVQMYSDKTSFLNIITDKLEDEKVYRLFVNGYTQNIFQFGSAGMTKFVMDMKPESITDLIAANALFRPATIESGSTENYVDCKNGTKEPVYLWGTYDILKETFAQLCYQEDLARMAREIGGFSLAEGVHLVKHISKKKVDKILAMKDKFMTGAKSKGCPDEDAQAIWRMFESAGTYLFNKCISGKEMIYRPHGGKWKPTIGEMYKIMNDQNYAKETKHVDLRVKYVTYGYGIGFSLNEENKLVSNRIRDIRYMGVKELYRITLDDGKTIDVTCNHKHPTSNGLKRTDELIVGVDQMYVNIGHISQDTVYRFTDKGKYNNETYHNNDNIISYELNSKKGHMGFIERPDSDYVKFEHYRKFMMKDSCEQCDKSSNRLEIHHIDGNHANCNFENLMTLCVSCHKKAHYNMGRTKMGKRGLYTELRNIVSIESIGFDEVYDVEMENPYHTFCTGNGIVTCNSHATAYALTAYIGAWYKANYPTAFYTVALEYAKDENISSLMAEMEQASSCKIVHPDINVSDIEFITDYKTNEIFWSLSRIKFVGGESVNYIISERDKNGPYSSLEDFCRRIFRKKLLKLPGEDRCPVNSRQVKNLILSGCFDKVENALSVIERYALLQKASEIIGFEISENDFPEDKISQHYFWSMLQIAISGIGSVDYRRVYDNSDFKGKIRNISYKDIAQCRDMMMDGNKAIICATIVEIKEKSYVDKETKEKKAFATLYLQQNNELIELLLWPEAYEQNKLKLTNAKDKIILMSCMVKWSDFSSQNILQGYKGSLIEIV